MTNIYQINKGLIVQKIDDKTVIFDGDESILYTLNETASYIFKKLKAKIDEVEIIKLMIKRYGIAENKAKKDVKELISDLKKKKIVKISS